MIIHFPDWVTVTKCKTYTNKFVYPRGHVNIPGAVNDIHGATYVLIQSDVK